MAQKKLHPRTAQVITMLTVEDRRRLSWLADQQRVSMSELVRELVLGELARYQIPGGPELPGQLELDQLGWLAKPDGDREKQTAWPID